MKKIIIIFVLVLFSCSENKKDVNTDADNGGTNGGNGGMKPMKDRVGKIHYAASTPCQAGDYSIYPNGLKSVTIECGHDGKLSKQTLFSYGFGSVKNYNTLFKISETLYRADGSRERETNFGENGNKSQEYLHYTDGTRKLFTYFRVNGNKYYETLYRTDGTQRKLQWFNNDGTVSSTSYYMADGTTQCSPSSTKCVDSDPE